MHLAWKYREYRAFCVENLSCPEHNFPALSKIGLLSTHFVRSGRTLSHQRLCCSGHKKHRLFQKPSYWQI